jgi:hypothetical protein
MLHKAIVYNALGFVACGLLLTSCGGGGGGGGGDTAARTETPTVASGVLVDSAVEGVAFRSGGQSGETDSTGAYTYEVGKLVTFSIGGVELGSVTGAGVLTPLDLVGGSSDDVEALNLVRFLLMLDEDSDSSNGIFISNAVRAIAASWLQVDFSTADLEAELAAIMSDVASADGRTPTLADSADAKNHLEDSIACLASGIFSGSFSGDDSGTYLMWIQSQRYDPDFFGDTQPRKGVTSALIYSNGDATVYGVEPIEGISYSNDKQFVSGTTTSAAVYSGEVKDYKTFVNGVWKNDFFNETGTFSGGRKAGASDAVHRLSGFINLIGSPFTRDGSALIGLDVFADDTVSGVMVTLAGQEVALVGKLEGDIITVDDGGDQAFTLVFFPQNSDPAGILGGTAGFFGEWNLDGSNIGTVIGSSCKLN